MWATVHMFSNFTPTYSALTYSIQLYNRYVAKPRQAGSHFVWAMV